MPAPDSDPNSVSPFNLKKYSPPVATKSIYEFTESSNANLATTPWLKSKKTRWCQVTKRRYPPPSTLTKIKPSKNLILRGLNPILKQSPKFASAKQAILNSIPCCINFNIRPSLARHPNHKPPLLCVGPHNLKLLTAS